MWREHLTRFTVVDTVRRFYVSNVTQDYPSRRILTNYLVTIMGVPHMHNCKKIQPRFCRFMKITSVCLLSSLSLLCWLWSSVKIYSYSTIVCLGGSLCLPRGSNCFNPRIKSQMNVTQWSEIIKIVSFANLWIYSSNEMLYLTPVNGSTYEIAIFLIQVGYRSTVRNRTMGGGPYLFCLGFESSAKSCRRRLQ